MSLSAASNPTSQFTGKERDAETGLDWFATRYMSSAQGRFTSPDSYNIVIEMLKGRDAQEQRTILNDYISNPQVWNKYAYVLNNPLVNSDPDGRRAMTEDDARRLQELFNYAKASGDQDVMGAIDASLQAIVAAIDAVPEGEADPVSLQVAFNAIGQLGNSNWGKNGTIEAFGRSFGPGNNKCNIFVAAMYQLSGADYPLSPVTGLPPRANDLGTASKIGKFGSVSQAGVGDIVAWPQRLGWIGSSMFSGHSSISLGSNLVVYAGQSGLKLNTIGKTWEQLGTIKNSDANYLRYKK
jgi:RHS repeat-associated protein